MREGTAPPKTKKGELVLRLVVSIHVIEHIILSKLNGVQETNPPTEIKKETLVKAMYFLELMESQKELFVSVSASAGF